EHQAWILRRFLTQVEGQEAADEEEPHSIVGEFARLKSQSNKFRNEKTYSSKAAEKQENVKKNRYKDIVPFDHSRVKLNFITSRNDSDYINASFIRGVFSSTEYIATQGPLPHTLLDFFRMLWEYNAEVVIMACREFEMGKLSEESRGDYLARTLQVTYKNVSTVSWANSPQTDGRFSSPATR
uniref:protein-tyrosine-phosphatase n=1 Tax=Tetraodon nigroviridis TaxID=99883 RepID=H3C4K7_TETNG